MPAIPRMLGFCLMVSLLLITATASAAPPGAPGPVPPSQVVPDRYIVVLRDTVPSAAAVAVDLEARLGIAVSHVYEHALRGFAANVPPGRLLALQRDPRVAYVEADQTVYAFGQTIPTGIRRIFAPGNGELSINGSDDFRVDVDVAVIDTGIAEHPDLHIVGRTDCSGGSPRNKSCSDGSGTDGNGHGTHVAGTIAALDNDLGVVGVAPGARLWSVKVLSDNGSGYMSWIVAGVDWVTARHGTIGVANMSLGCECSSSALDTAISNSVAKGVVYVVAAGNSAKNVSTFSPANHPDVIAVSALADFNGEPGGGAKATCRTDEDDTLANFSNYGAEIHIAAPGVCILSTWLKNDYHTISGTSMASPHVAGAAALLVSKSKPGNKTEALAIRKTLRDKGNFNWIDDSGDGVTEPLLDVSNTTFFDPKLTPGGGGTTTTDNPPTVLITSPTNGATVSGTVSITADAGDDKGVNQVEFFSNDTSLGVDTVASDGWSALWDTTLVADGLYTLMATATDTGGQKTSHSISVTVANVTGGGSTTEMGVYQINWSGSKHLDVTINIRRDSDAGGTLTSGDAVVSGAGVTFDLTRLSTGTTWTFAGNTDSNGNFRGRLINAPSDDYRATVTGVNASGLDWKKTLDRENPEEYKKP